MGRPLMKNNKRDVLIEGTIKALARNLALGKIPGFYKDDSNKDFRQQWGAHLNWPFPS